MVAIDIEMPKNCIECDIIGLQQIIDCQLIYSGCANCGRHPSCPLKEIITCGECYHCKKKLVEGVEYLQCIRDGSDTDEDGYCDYGERRE